MSRLPDPHTALPVLTLAAAILLAGCTPIEVRHESTVRLPARFEQVPASAGPADTPAPPASSTDQHRPAPAGTELSQWWRTWHDPVLDSLLEQARAASPELAAARARLDAARATAALAQADLGPQLGIRADGALLDGIDTPLPASLRPGLAAAGLPAASQAHFNRPSLHAIGLAASWEPDIFGGKQSDADAAAHAALAQTEQWHGAQLLLAASLADHYVQARTLQRQRELGQARLARLRQLQRYVQARFRAGQTSAHELREMDIAIRTTEAALATLDARTAAQVRSIAVLLGRPPQGYRLPDSPRDVLGSLPAPPAGQYPVTILDRRPDVRASERLLQAQAARLASARADRLPRLDIRFLWQHGRIGLDSDLPGMSGHAALLDAGLTIPLFTAGRISRNIDLADARLKEAAARHDQTLLQALAEVDSSYQLQHELHQQSALLAEAGEQARQQADGAERLFRHGQMNLDRSLRSQLQALELAERLLLSRQAEARNLIRLYKTLGGGWSTPSAPTDSAAPPALGGQPEQSAANSPPAPGARTGHVISSVRNKVPG